MHFSPHRTFFLTSLFLVVLASCSLHAASERPDTAATEQLDQEPSPLMMFGGDGVEEESPNTVQNNNHSGDSLPAGNFQDQQRYNGTSRLSGPDTSNEQTTQAASISPRVPEASRVISSSNMNNILPTSSFGPSQPSLDTVPIVDDTAQKEIGSFGVFSVTVTDSQMPHTSNEIMSRSSSNEIAMGLSAHSVTQVSENNVDYEEIAPGIITKINEQNQTLQRMGEFRESFSTEIKSISEKATAARQLAIDRATTTSARTMIMAPGLSSSIGRPNAEARRERAFNTIDADVNRDTMIATFNLRKNLAPHQKALENLLLEKRKVRKNRIEQYVPFKMNEGDRTQDLKDLRRNLEQAQSIRTSAISLISNIEQASDDDLSFALQAFDAADTMTAMTLAPNADAEISEARIKLNDIDNSLTALSTKDLPSENPFSSRPTITKIQQTFKEADASFLLAQTHSDMAAKIVADDHAHYFFKEAQKLKTTATESSHEIEHASQNDTAFLEKQVEILNKVALILEKAALAYDQIGDACSTEIRKLPQNKENFLQLCETISGSEDISGKSPTSQVKKNIVNELNNFKDPDQSTEPVIGKYGFNFLSQLEGLSADHDTDAIIGHNGQIALEPVPSSTEAMSDNHRLSYNFGVNLIRLTLFRDFGSHAVERFDTRFRGKIAAQNPLQLSQLRAFMESENQINPSSYFISSRHSLEELLGASGKEDSSEDTKIIKSDDTPTPFNPFLNMPVSELADESKSAERGITATKEALEGYLKSQQLDPHRIRSIVAHFEHRFSDSKNKLTVGALKSFYNQEEQQTSFDWHSWLRGPARDIHLNNLLWHATQGVTFVARTHLPFFAAPTLFGAMNTFNLTAAMAWISDLTIDWRRMPTERDEGH